MTRSPGSPTWLPTCSISPGCRRARSSWRGTQLTWTSWCMKRSRTCSPPPPITGDRERLGHVLIILLTNAIKYSPQADTVVVRVAHARDALTVSVQDFGIGIARSHQQRLFERFYRVLSKEDQTYPGLGIGLYIAYEIIQRHGGKMWLESVEGNGSTFFFSLPTGE